MIQHFKYVPGGNVEDYFRMGWMMTDRPFQYEGDGFVMWLMVYPCNCRLPYKQRQPK